MRCQAHCLNEMSRRWIVLYKYGFFHHQTNHQNERLVTNRAALSNQPSDWAFLNSYL